jgi:hypothetical protein
MYSVLLPLDANAYRHNNDSTVPSSGSWRELMRAWRHAILRAVFRRHGD